MSGRRRLATFFIVALIVGGIFFLFRGAPTAKSLTYDLGAGHPEVVRLEVRVMLGAELVRRLEWRFAEGMAPRRVSHEPTLPSEQMTVLIEIESTGDRIVEERRELDWTEPGDVIFHLQSPLPEGG